MTIGHRTNRLKLVGIPDVEQLQNGRYQLTINCTPLNKREAWYNSNKSRIFPDYGSLQSAEMSIDGLAPRTGEAYTDMRLVSVRSSSQGEQYIVTLVYQTLGSSFVQVKDDTVNYLENGLRRVTRNSIANAGTDFQKTIGTTSITSQIDGESAVTCVLANYEVNDTDSFREVTEIYVESGIFTLSTPQIGGQQRVEVAAFNLTSTEVSNLLSEVTINHKLIDSSISNYKGIKTFQYTFEVDDFEKTSQEADGLKTLTRTELSTTNFSDGDVGIDVYKNLTLSGEEIDNGNTIKVKTSLFVEHGLLDESKGNARDGIRNVSKTFLGTEEEVNGPITSRTVQNTNGIKTITVNFVEGEDGTKITGTTPQLVKQSTSLEPFNIPGLVRLIKSDKKSGGRGSNPTIVTTVNYSFELTGPVQTKVPTTTFVLYQTSNSIDEANDYTYNSARALWNPGGWAKSRVQGLDTNGKPFSISKAYRGYRAPETYDQFTVTNGKLNRNSYAYPTRAAYVIAMKNSSLSVFIDGYQMSSQTVPTISLKGGPENPVGRKYVTNVSISPAFTDVDGVQYYKKIIKVADVEGDQIVFCVYPRNKDSGNHFTTAQRMVVYDYRSDTNSILIGSNINSGNVVGLYNSGDIAVNASYEFARCELTDFTTTGTILDKFSSAGKVFVLSEGFCPDKDVYTGWKLKFTSGLRATESFTIANSFGDKFYISEGSGANQMSDFIYNKIAASDAIELIPPATF